MELQQWLAPPNPSVNHNTAHDTQHNGTANWFIQGRTFDEWKTNGSLLWIRGSRMLLLPCHTLMIANGLTGFFSGVWQEYSLVRSYTTIPLIETYTVVKFGHYRGNQAYSKIEIGSGRVLLLRLQGCRQTRCPRLADFHSHATR
jgi:hypothetical protein